MKPISKIALTFFVTLFIGGGIFVAWQLTGQSKTNYGKTATNASDTDKKAESDCEKNLKKLFAENRNIQYGDECPENITKWQEPFITGYEYVKKTKPEPFSGVPISKNWDIRELPIGARMIYLVPWTRSLFFKDIKRYIPENRDFSEMFGKEREIWYYMDPLDTELETMVIEAYLMFYSPFEGPGYIPMQKQYYRNTYVEVYFSNGLVVKGMERDFPGIADNPHSARVLLDQKGNLVKFYPKK